MSAHPLLLAALYGVVAVGLASLAASVYASEWGGRTASAVLLTGGAAVLGGLAVEILWSLVR